MLHVRQRLDKLREHLFLLQVAETDFQIEAAQGSVVQRIHEICGTEEPQEF